MQVEAPSVKEDWPRPLIIKCLREYQRMVITNRMAPREERIATSPPSQKEASFSATARMLADLERALQRQPYQSAQITFMVLCMGASSWRTGETYSWRKRISEWWDITPSEVNRIAEETINAIYEDLNRVSIY